jgi:hypothetical protein
MSDLITLETKALKHLANSRDEWRMFCDTVDTIKASESWSQKARTWDSYCKQVFGVGASRIRQHLNAAQLSDAMVAINGIPLTGERQARTLSEFAETVEDKATIHKLATEAAKVLDAPLTRGIYAAVVETLDEIGVTNGSTSLEGESIPAHTTPDTLHLAIVERARETKRRETEHRTQGLIDATVRLRVIDSVAYAVIQLPSDYPVALLKDWIAKVPKPRIPASVVSPSADSLEAVA